MHPDHPERDFVDAAEQFVQRNVERPGYVALVVLIELTNIEDGEGLLGANFARAAKSATR
jgi:hypothetical protein